MVRFKRMAKDISLLCKPSVLEKLEKDSVKADKYSESFFGTMPSKHVCDTFHESSFECDALGK